MPGIICAIRGGPHSKPTIERAIVLARETGQTLHFLYVVNLDFLLHTSSTRVHTISEQMSQMGEFILLAARETAAQQGVESLGLIRHGSVGGQIIALCHELGTEYLVLGWPKAEHEHSVFTQERLYEFVARTEEQTGARVVFPEGGER